MQVRALFAMGLMLLGCSTGGALGPAKAPRSSAAPTEAYAGAAPEAMAEQAERPGLGTSFGESRQSPVREVSFTRAGSAPTYLATLHYNDGAGVLAQARRFGEQRPYGAGEPLFQRRAGASLWGGVTIQVVGEDGAPLPAWHVGGRVLVAGEHGRRYALRVDNRTGQRFEVVASVDGLDVIDGRSASPGKPGYVIGPYARLEIDGYRRSYQEVAAFRFGAVSDSYAARTAESGDRNVGVIGVALFSERGAPDLPDLDEEARRREQADPFPGRFAQPPN